MVLPHLAHTQAELAEAEAALLLEEAAPAGRLLVTADMAVEREVTAEAEAGGGLQEALEQGWVVVELTLRQVLASCLAPVPLIRMVDQHLAGGITHSPILCSGRAMVWQPLQTRWRWSAHQQDGLPQLLLGVADVLLLTTAAKAGQEG